MQPPGDDAPAGCPFSGARAAHSAQAAPAAHEASHVPGDAGWHNAQLDFSKSMSYGDYLSLNSILDAQHPLSPDHNGCCSSSSIRRASCG